MKAHRLLFADQRSRSRLAPIHAALVSLASLGLVLFAFALWPNPAPRSTDRPQPRDAASAQPVEGVIHTAPQGRDAAINKKWM
jgi:hypothetical protein